MQGSGTEEAAKDAAADVGWNNMGTYVGVGGVAVAALLFYMRALRAMFAAILAAIAVAAGWFLQPEKKPTK